VTAVYNQGDEAIGSATKPVHATVYYGTGSKTSSNADINVDVIYPGDTAYIIIPFTSLTPVVNVVVRVNDNGTNFPEYNEECEYGNNEMTLVNPSFNQLMRKNASIGGVLDNGLYGDPVSVLYGDTILYKITAYNVGQSVGRVIVRDTLPAYLKYATGTASPASAFSSATVYGTPDLDALMWILDGIAPSDDTIVSYKATPVKDVCYSQPLFVNRAWITSSDVYTVVTGNSTYHQGAGASIVLFSAGFGGSIYNAQPQVLDYRTSAGVGILTVADDGYAFVGWSHDDYYSLRGERIAAKSGIMHYDTLVVFGDVELAANFELIRYPIRYYLNGGENAGNNPDEYTIKSNVITLEEPHKAGDVFTGWTGTNGVEPQKTVTIPEGSTGELEFYANYLYSGRENKMPVEVETDKIWGAEDELYVRTSKKGSIVRIYSTDGVLEGLHTIIATGITKIKLQRGIHIVTLNNGAAQKIFIE
jgi:uncharacterized repeat protein (TIGR02543 family)/uncharacterized repeat protein (TIGR01451 family)